MKALIKIQSELKAPKNQRNKFGNYNYRSCEDILEAVKPLCAKEGALLTISDEIEDKAGHLFVKATVTFTHGDFCKSVTAYAMHALSKKGMDESQITGAASSYARKYALNGLFCIDDTKDADTKSPQENTAKAEVKTIFMSDKVFDELIEKINDAMFKEDLKPVYNELVKWSKEPYSMNNKQKNELGKAYQGKQSNLK